MTLLAKKVPLLVVLILCNLFAYTQIPDNFEFLDHRLRSSFLGATKMMGDKIYYVSHNRVNPWTTFNVVDKDRNVETLFSLNYDFSNSKLFEINDTSAVIIIDNLIEYDIGTPGYYMITLSPNELSIDSIFTERGISEVYVTDVSFDSLGRQVLSTYNSLMTVDNGELVDFLSMEPPYKILHNSKFQLFGYGSGEVSRFEDGKFFSIIKEEDIGIRNVKSYSDRMYLIAKEYSNDNIILKVYNEDFSEEIYTIELPNGITSIDQFVFSENDIQIINAHDNILEILLLDNEGGLSTVHTSEFKDEIYSKFVPLDQERLLLMGVYGHDFNQYGLSRFSRNIFFRNYSLTEENTYDRVNVTLHDFELNRVYSDTTSIQTYPSTGTLHFGQHDLEMELSIQNQGVEDISLVNIYSIDDLDDVHPKFHFDFEYSGIISPSEIKTSEYEKSSYIAAEFLRDSVEIPFFIPGADFKFNENPLWDFEVVVDIEELIEDAAFTLYPNPTDDFLNLSFDKAISTVLIYDVNGMLQLSNFGSKALNKIEVSNLPAGTYFLRANLKSQKGYLVTKFIKI